MSEVSRELFNQARIKNDALSVVSEILAPDGQNQCMMERLVANISDPAEGRKVLLNFFREKEML